MGYHLFVMIPLLSLPLLSIASGDPIQDVQSLNYSFNLVEDDDIISQTRNLADSVKITLRKLAKDPKSSIIVSRIINDENNVCIEDLYDGINYIEQATSLVEAARDDIELLVEKIQSFINLTDPSTVVKETAAILKILEPLVSNIAPDAPFICQATPDQAFGSLRNLAVLVDQLSLTRDLNMTEEGRGELRQSANVISSVTTFITRLRETFVKFQLVCTPNKQYNIKSLNAIGDLMEHLADVFGSLGGIQEGENIRKGKNFVNKIVVSTNM